MTRRRSRIRWWFLPWLSFAAAPASADLSTALADCAARFGDDDEYRLRLLTDVCPEAALALEAGGWDDLLGEIRRDTLTYWDASQLDRLIAYYRDDGDGGPTIDLGTLDRIVDGLEPPAGDDDESLFQRFMDWLRELLGDDDESEGGWFGEWWSDVRIPEYVIRATFYTLAGLIILSALAVVAIEVIAARRGSSRAVPVGSRTGPATVPATPGRPLTLADLDRADLRDKPAMLLELLLRRLASAGLMTRRPASTHRDLSRDSTCLAGSDAVVLARLADSAERVRYGDVAPDPGSIDELVTRGVAMFRRLGDGRT